MRGINLSTIRKLIWSIVIDDFKEEESGQAMVEFAILCLPQLILITGIIQLCLINMAHVVVNHAAFKAARVALVADEFENSSVGFENARKAAVAVCSAIANDNGVASGGTPIQFQGQNGAIKLNRSPAAEVKTKLIIRVDANRRTICAIVKHEYELIMPFGQFFWDQDKTKYGSPHIDIIESYIMPLPWTPKNTDVANQEFSY